MEKDQNIDKELQRNLLRIIDERFDGNQAAFCRELGFNPTYINAVVRGHKNLGKANWEKIMKSLELRPEEFLRTAKPGASKEQQKVLDWYHEMEAAGMTKEAEMMMEYLSNAAKKKGAAGGEGAKSRVPRSRVKKAG